jgi:hypothetical protein
MVYRTLTVAIPDESASKLDALARDSFRRPKEQAAALLIDAIERASRRRARSAESLRVDVEPEQ